MLTLTKFTDVSEAIVGDTILYTIRVNNTSGFLLSSVVVKDLLSPDLDFVEGSVAVGGFPKATASILTGVESGPIGIGSIVDVTFKAVIINKSGDYVTNQGTVVYTYTDPADGLKKVETEQTNVAEVLVEIAELFVTKIADVTEASLNDIIHYRATIENKGTIPATNIIFTDKLPENVELIQDSVKVDSVLVNNPDFETGMNVGDLASGETIIIDYAVKVISGACSGTIINCALATYNYVLPNTVTSVKQSNKAEVTVKVTITAFKQLTIDKFFPIPVQKPDIEEVDDVVVEIKIDDSYIVNTVQKVSNEGQQLSGYKLIIHGNIKMSIEYTALLPDQPMHSAHCVTPFSTFIILPMDYDGGEVDVSTILEDVDIDMINRRGVDVGIVFLVIAQTK